MFRKLAEQDSDRVTQPTKGQQPGGIDKDDLYRNDQWFRCMVKCYHSIVVLHDQQWLHQP